MVQEEACSDSFDQVALDFGRSATTKLLCQQAYTRLNTSQLSRNGGWRNKSLMYGMRQQHTRDDIDCQQGKKLQEIVNNSSQ